jgi:hypothetical protein
MDDEFAPVIEEIDFALAEMAALKAAGPHLKILHRWHEAGTDCAPGEETALIWFVYRAREFVVPLPLAERLLVDYWAHCRLPQTASQIEAGFRADPYCSRHGANARTLRKQTRNIGRTSVRVYVERIREALQIAFTEAGVNLDPYQVLASKRTTGNQILYQLKAYVDWIHMR